MKKILFILLSFFLLHSFAYASEKNIVLSEETKYFKTLTYFGDYNFYGSIPNFEHTVEITKEEYEKDDISDKSNTIVETTYKRMTTSISKTGSNYQYKVNLYWKNIPKIRSYDIIGIGFPSSVKVFSTPVFVQNYCLSLDDCYSSSSHKYLYSGNNGVGVAFQVPTGNLLSMEQTLYFVVQKNTVSTIVTQYACGDYSHAIKNVSLSNAKKFTVNTSGIELTDNNISYYDEISVSKAVWNGTW